MARAIQYFKFTAMFIYTYKLFKQLHIYYKKCTYAVLHKTSNYYSSAYIYVCMYRHTHTHTQQYFVKKGL